MKRIIILAVSAIFILTLTACPNFEDHCSSEVHSFLIPIKVTVPRDTLNIGDTIWFESSFSALVRDTTLKKDLLLRNGIFSVSLGVNEYYFTDQSQKGLKSAQDKFERIVRNGKPIDFSGVYFSYLSATNSYGIKIGYVAKKEGEYMIHYHGSEVNEEGVDCDPFKNGTPYPLPYEHPNLFEKLNQKYGVVFQEGYDQSILQSGFGFIVK
ncbi:MAG: hypothetical protein OHK0038_21540 [Flammeovirgaceae bacterium]